MKCRLIGLGFVTCDLAYVAKSAKDTNSYDLCNCTWWVQDYRRHHLRSEEKRSQHKLLSEYMTNDHCSPRKLCLVYDKLIDLLIVIALYSNAAVNITRFSLYY